ncbi:hypothetical protein ANANG_G00277490, partial [Anguilla anguilla]
MVWTRSHGQVCPPAPSLHVADVFGGVAARLLSGRSEADLAARVPATAYPRQPPRHAGQRQAQPAQQHCTRQGQLQHEAGRQVELVGARVEGPVPAEGQCVQGGDGQRRVAQPGLEAHKRNGEVSISA